MLTCVSPQRNGWIGASPAPRPSRAQDGGAAGADPLLESAGLIPPRDEVASPCCRGRAGNSQAAHPGRAGEARGDRRDGDFPAWAERAWPFTIERREAARDRGDPDMHTDRRHGNPTLPGESTMTSPGHGSRAPWPRRLRAAGVGIALSVALGACGSATQQPPASATAQSPPAATQSADSFARIPEIVQKVQPSIVTVFSERSAGGAEPARASEAASSTAPMGSS